MSKFSNNVEKAAAMKYLGTGLGLSGLLDFIANDGDYTPESMSKGRIANALFNFGIGAGGLHLINKGHSPAGVSAMIAAPVKDVALKSLGTLHETDKFMESSRTSNRLMGGGAIALAAGVPAALIYGARRMKNQAPADTSKETGEVTVTLPTRDPGDAETTVKLPIDAFNLSQSAKNDLARDVRRRLRAERAERTKVRHPDTGRLVNDWTLNKEQEEQKAATMQVTSHRKHLANILTKSSAMANMSAQKNQYAAGQTMNQNGMPSRYVLDITSPQGAGGAGGVNADQVAQLEKQVTDMQKQVEQAQKAQQQQPAAAEGTPMVPGISPGLVARSQSLMQKTHNISKAAKFLKMAGWWEDFRNRQGQKFLESQSQTNDPNVARSVIKDVTSGDSLNRGIMGAVGALEPGMTQLAKDTREGGSLKIDPSRDTEMSQGIKNVGNTVQRNTSGWIADKYMGAVDEYGKAVDLGRQYDAINKEYGRAAYSNKWYVPKFLEDIADWGTLTLEEQELKRQSEIAKAQAASKLGNPSALRAMGTGFSTGAQTAGNVLSGGLVGATRMGIAKGLVAGGIAAAPGWLANNEGVGYQGGSQGATQPSPVNIFGNPGSLQNYQYSGYQNPQNYMTSMIQPYTSPMHQMGSSAMQYGNTLSRALGGPQLTASYQPTGQRSQPSGLNLAGMNFPSSFGQ